MGMFISHAKFIKLVRVQSYLNSILRKPPGLMWFLEGLRFFQGSGGGVVVVMVD